MLNAIRHESAPKGKVMNQPPIDPTPVGAERTSRYVLVWCLAIGGYSGLILFGLLQGLGVFEADSATRELWVHISLAALLIGLIIGLAIVLFERLRDRQHDPYGEVKE